MADTTNKDWTWGAIVIIILLAIIGFGCYSLATGKDLKVIEVVLTALLMKFGTLIDFKYGSSKGSKEKTEMMAQRDNIPVAPAAPPVINFSSPAPVAGLDAEQLNKTLLNILKSVQTDAAPVVEEVKEAVAKTEETK